MTAFYQVCQRSPLPIDPLCCHEEDLFPFWEEEVEPAAEAAAGRAQCDRDEAAGDEESVELGALLSKEADSQFATKLFLSYLDADPSLSCVRLDAVRWLLKASARHGFTAQTSLLAVDYLDRFLFSTRCGGAAGGPQQQQPWMTQLLAVACLSLAAKMEETHVPLLLDLQVEEARYVFEARTIRRMELLVLCTLGWKMGSPTPLSFIDHFLRRRSAAAEIANKTDAQQPQRWYVQLHWRFQATCQSILLALVTDSRWVRFPASVLAAAAMLHALAQLLVDSHSAPPSTLNWQDSLMGLLSVNKDQVQTCTEFILDAAGNGSGESAGEGRGGAARDKRKLPLMTPPSPRSVTDAAFSYESCGNSQAAFASTYMSSAPDMSPPRAFKRLHSMAAVGGDAEQCHPRPLLDGLFV